MMMMMGKYDKKRKAWSERRRRKDYRKLKLLIKRGGVFVKLYFHYRSVLYSTQSSVILANSAC